MMPQLREFVPLVPIHFFTLSCEIPYMSQETFKKRSFSKKYLLPETHLLSSDAPLGAVYAAWNEEELLFLVEPLKRIALRSVELFIDTRDVKSSGFNTRFCHHFFASADDEICREVTHFRGPDKHPLCQDELLLVKREGSSLFIKIPKIALFGFDSDQFNRLGFSYRLTFDKGLQQHFSVSSANYKIEEEPSLLASCTLFQAAPF